MNIDRDTLVRRFALGGVIIATTILSYATLKHRATEIGFPELASWFYPLAYDAMILASSRMWQNHTLSDSTRKLAKFATLGFIGAALAVFVAEFAEQGPMAVAFALPVPAALAVALVLTSRAAADRKAAAEKTRDEPTEVDEETAPDPEPEPVSVASEASTAPAYAPVSITMPATTDTPHPPTEVSFTEIPMTQLPEFEPSDKRAWIHFKLDNGVELTGAMIDKQFGGRNGARTLKSVREERRMRNGHQVEVKA